MDPGHLSTLQNIAQAIQVVATAVGKVFTVSANSTGATAGTANLPAAPAAYWSVTTSSGGVYKVPLYNS